MNSVILGSKGMQFRLHYKRNTGRQTFKLLISFVSPGFGLTIACFNFPFSEMSINSHKVTQISENIIQKKNRMKDKKVFL